MNKVMIYSVIAVVLGLLLTLTPLLMLADFKAENYFGTLCSSPRQMEKLEGKTRGLDTQIYSVADLEVLAISFMLALAAYVLLKWRMQH